MIRLRVSLSGAWRDTDSVSCSSNSAKRRMPGMTPQVERLMCRIPMFSPSGWFTNSRNRSTLSRLSMGSPIPMRTILDTGTPLSDWVKITCSNISPGVRSRTFPPRVDAQKAQPIRHPTWVETHTVLPWR